jgi:hypothetical protein
MGSLLRLGLLLSLIVATTVHVRIATFVVVKEAPGKTERQNKRQSPAQFSL